MGQVWLRIEGKDPRLEGILGPNRNAPSATRKRTLAVAPSRAPSLAPFHLAFPVSDLALTRDFYGRVLGCPEGRSSSEWIDFDLFGHQIVAHLAPPRPPEAGRGDHHNGVDGHDVPVPHFGVVLDWDDFHALSERLRGHGVRFAIEPYVRFKGLVGEQATMFFRDPSGNALEFKAFRDRSQLFAR
jgi:extradiol dioxygenase family protein